MITSAKIAAFTTLFLLVFALIPGATADFLLVPEGFRLETLAACGLFVAGILLGALLVGDRSTIHGNRLAADRSDWGFLLLGGVMLLMLSYIVIAGPVAPIFAAASGLDPIESALLREEAIKLNTDAMFVRVYSNARDILAPAVFILSLELMTRSSSRVFMRFLALFLFCSAMFIGLWSGQKATIINYILAAMIFFARDTAALLRLIIVGAPIISVAILGMFLVTYPGTFDPSEQISPLLQNVMEGLIQRLFVGPFEVSVAYVDAVTNQNLIHPVNALPVVGAMLRPGFPTIENIIGTHYFFSGIDSISANALCFAYAYIIGGLTFCFAMGALVPIGIIMSTRIVRMGGSVFLERVFHAVVAYKLMDLLGGNPLGYLIGIIQLAVMTWFLARASIGLSRLRVARSSSSAT